MIPIISQSDHQNYHLSSWEYLDPLDKEKRGNHGLAFLATR
jgi:hypothetical protein